MHGRKVASILLVFIPRALYCCGHEPFAVQASAVLSICFYIDYFWFDNAVCSSPCISFC
jgi:hypothetical protein